MFDALKFDTKVDKSVEEDYDYVVFTDDEEIESTDFVLENDKRIPSSSKISSYSNLM